ncbi:MAG TPA: TPM domain-containing protein, partial [Rhizobacter sp.]|nr:TPM domain-containing protein [Rhizobacter sp.]
MGNNKWLRILRHRLLDETDARRALDAQALQRLQERVAASERGHSGEIRICVEASLPLSYLWRHATARQRAVTMFGKLRVWDTEHNNGVLIYLLLAEHAIEIVADRGLHRRVDADTWTRLVAELGAALRASQFEQGL